MAGEAQSINFAVGTATIMVGNPADLRDFRPETHSLGLVKNVKIMAEANYIQLPQGIRNEIVHSIKAGEPVSMGAEIYEYNAKNWNYALGFSGYEVSVTPAVHYVTTAVVATLLGTSTFDVDAVAGFTVGDYVNVQVGNTSDSVIPRRITGTTPTTVTFDAPIKNQAIPVGASIRKVNIIPVGRQSEQPFLAAKIVGSMADQVEVVIEIPKLRITKGFDLTFQTSDYANMPFEFTCYAQVPTDAQYARFKNEFDKATAIIYSQN
jgi:hypothetical protein